MTTKKLYKHRILPGHMGGTYDPRNVEMLTLEEHARAHYRLFQVFGAWQDQLAWRALSGQLANEEVNLYKMKLSKQGVNHPMYGRNHSEESKRKMSESHKKMSDETKKKIGEKSKGRPGHWKSHKVTEDARLKMSQAKKGKPWSAARRACLNKSSVV